MAQVTVTLDEDHLERLIKSPVTGLGELIWNALDADATEVDADVELQDLGGIEAVVVTDNGLGMDYAEAEQGFGALGGSWKRAEQETRRDRRVVHGSRGEGRYASFAIGNRVTWRSVHADEQGTTTEITIIGRRTALKVFDISDPLPVSDATGTEVRVQLLTEKATRSLDRADVADNLTVQMALYLEQYPVTVKWRGQNLSPAALQQHRAIYDLDVPDVEGDVRLVVIEWTKPFDRSLWLCDGRGVALHETAPGIQAPGYDFTGYIQWDGFKDFEPHDLMLAELGQKDMTPILEAARDALRAHFRERSETQQREIIERWKKEHTYPYAAATPRTQLERAERDLFDVVAVTAAKAIDASEVAARRLSLRLLREAVESRPTALRRILSEVIDLPPARLNDLTQLLDRTPLASIIAAAKTIADRIDFLSGLDTLLFDPDSKKQLLERRQLHRILAEETWLFGEEYALTGDDDRLEAVLRRHLQLLGEDVELAAGAPAREDGRDIIPDLVLSRQVSHHENELQHLVVELKRPKVDIGLEQLRQIEDYALAVGRDDRFKQDNVQWEFLIVSNALTEDVQRRARQKDRPRGVVHEDANLRIWAKTWAEVIGDARHRLKFAQRSLDYRSTRDAGVTYLRETHDRYLPTSVANAPSEAVTPNASPDDVASST